MFDPRFGNHDHRMRPCPFCGDNMPFVKEYDSLRPGEHFWRVNCQECWAIGPEGDSSAEAIERWNERYTDEETRRRS